MINRAWHDAHRLPQRATLAQRVAWHREHAQACACRPMPASIAAEIAAQEKSAPQSEDGAGG
jgi:hypothetical protein